MGLKQTLLRAIGWPSAPLQFRSTMLEGVRPPARAHHTTVNAESATTLHSVYRAIEIILNSGTQISIDAKRNGQIIDDQPALIRRPSLTLERDDFIEQSLMSLIVDGNLFWLRRLDGARVVELDVLNPYLVTVTTDPKTGRKSYHYGGKTYGPAEIIHRTRMLLPGQLRGRSVMQTAADDLAGAMAVRDYANGVFDDSRVIDGVLKSDQAINAEDARAARYAFDRRDLETGEPLDEPYGSTLRVLGKGFDYESLTIHPKDAQWLESQAFDVTKIARMFGVPSSLMLVTLDGNSQTYSNVEQDWLAFVRFTLNGYLRKIESAFTEVLPNGQAAKFNVEALLRSDTLTRYRAHTMAVGRWQTVAEIRRIENLPALPDDELAALEASQSSPLPQTETMP